MPRKGDKRKGRRTRGTPVPQQPAAGSTATGVTTSSSNPATSKSSPPIKGRKTKNSLKGRQPPAKPTSVKRNGNVGRGMKRKAQSDQSTYISDDQIVYKPNDFAYVDSQQPDQPFHICRILSFRMARKDSVMAEVKWFYRVTELPEAVYELLMEDRKQGDYSAVFGLSAVKDRELFVAFNIDTHPAHLFRGKCTVKELSEISDKAEDYLKEEDHFFYQHGYKPESRRMTKMDEYSFIPYSQQAVLPNYIKIESSPSSSIEPNSESTTNEESSKVAHDRYNTPEERSTGLEEMLWKPKVEDDDLLMYLRAARSIALHAGVCMQGLLRDGYMAASSDETTQHAFDTLHRHNYNTDEALVNLVKKPIVGRLHHKKNWSKEHSLLFAKGMRQFGKNFRKIKKELLPNKEITQLIEYYYYWKKTTAGLSSRNTRKQRKQFHIRMSRAMLKTGDTATMPDREFIDVSSGDEEDIEEDGEKCFSYHACRHCYSTESNNWHHSGSDKTILCHECRLYFRKYGCMKPLSVKRNPPDFMFKDYHLALAEESGRKTRNSNNVRIHRTSLRNGKVFSKSDSDEEDEGEGSDTSYFSSTESVEVPVNNKTKGLQSRHSLLDLINKNSTNESNTKKGQETIIKQEKTDDKETASDEDGSEPSTTNGEGEEGSHKSSEERQSPSQSPDSSGEEQNITATHGPILATTPSASAPLAREQQSQPVLDVIPQQFKKVRNDSEGATCARTDLEYVHPPPEQKRALSEPQKAIPNFPRINFSPSFPQMVNHPTSSASQSNLTQSHTHSKQVPTITTYEPHLPSGPGHFIGFPIPANHPLQSPFSQPMIDPSSFGLHPRQFAPPGTVQEEELLLWQQQQQMLQKQLEVAQLQLIPQQHLQPPAGSSSNEQQHSLVFQYPSPEEMSRVRTGGPIPAQIAAQEGIPHHFHPLVAAAGGTPSVIMESRPPHHEELRQAPPHVSIPIQANFVNLDALQQQQLILAQHQQQQQAAAVQQQQTHLMITPEQFAEMQRQYIIALQELQKNPNAINNPNIQAIISQYQQIEPYVVQHQQQQMQQEALMQQELLKQQQQKFVTQSANRPGVIINLQGK